MSVNVSSITKPAMFMFSLHGKSYFGGSRLKKMMRKYGMQKASPRSPIYMGDITYPLLISLVDELEQCVRRIARYTTINDCKLLYDGEVVFECDVALKRIASVA